MLLNLLKYILLYRVFSLRFGCIIKCFGCC